MKADLVEIFEEFCLNSSTHGISSIYRTKTTLKLLWIFSTLASGSLCFYMIATSLLEYFSFPVNTNIEIINETPALFPTVSVCNLNSFKTDDSFVNSYLWDILNKTNIDQAKQTHPDLRITLSNKILQQNMSQNEMRTLFGWQMEDMIFHCKFNGYPCKYALDFEYFFNKNLQTCFKFNGREANLKKIAKSGLSTGLRLELYIGSWDNFTDNRGVRVVIHNHTRREIFPDDNGLNVEPGKKTMIGVKRTFYQKQAQPYSDCVDDVSLMENYGSRWLIHEMNLLNYTYYSSEVCEKMNYQKWIESMCNCSDASLHRLNDKLDICSSFELIMCQEIQFDIFYSNPSYYSEKNCLKGSYLYFYLCVLY